MSLNKFGRIPAVPLNSLFRDKAINGEILVNWDGLYLEGKNPSTGEIVRIGDTDSLYGIVNYIADTNFDMIPVDFLPSNVDLDVSKGTGWYNSNELVANFKSVGSSLYIKSQYKIYKNKNYTLTFYAKCNKTTIMHIRFGSKIYDLRIAKSPMSKYKIVINTNEFERNYFEGFYIEFIDNDVNISISQLMFEYGATANPWTDRTEITSAKVGDLNVNGILSINGIDILSIINGDGTKGTSATANDIVSDPKYIIPKTSDSNYDLISYIGEDGDSAIIASKSFENVLYGTYSFMIRMKVISESTSKDPIATINIYEETNSDRLLSSTDLYLSDFESNEFEEFGLVTKYNGNSDIDDRKLKFEIVGHGNGSTNIRIDYIYMSLAYTSLLPTFTTFS